MESTPAEDAVKLFVGQVPRDMAVEDLRSILMEAGHVFEVNIVRDRETRESKGCAFVTYMTRDEADNAIKVFHGVRHLTGAKAPMQVKYADGQEAKVENKLFVGMLPKSVTPEELRELFSPFGTILELNILKGPAHAIRGSAFVKFQQYSQAAAAVEGLNGKHRFEGQNNSMVVKWAESEKEKLAKRAQKHSAPGAQGFGMGPGQHGMGLLHGFPGGGPSAPMIFRPPGAASSHTPSMYGGPMAQLQFQGYVPSVDTPGGFHPPGGPHPPSSAPNAQQAVAYVSSGYSAYPEHVYTQGFQGGVGQGTAYLGEGMYSGDAGAGVGASGNGGVVGLGARGEPSVVTVQGVTSTSASAVAAAIREKLVEKEGPPGANIFVYNIPEEWGDADMVTAFCEFGNLLSTKVFIDKVTKRSKGFGFVAYQDKEAAQAALGIMDGFMVGGKKLRLSIKRNPTPSYAVVGMGGGTIQGTGDQHFRQEHQHQNLTLAGPGGNPT